MKKVLILAGILVVPMLGFSESFDVADIPITWEAAINTRCEIIWPDLDEDTELYSGRFTAIIYTEKVSDTGEIVSANQFTLQSVEVEDKTKKQVYSWLSSNGGAFLANVHKQAWINSVNEDPSTAKKDKKIYVAEVDGKPMRVWMRPAKEKELARKKVVKKDVELEITREFEGQLDISGKSIGAATTLTIVPEGR